ncbi:MAG: nuclear transport factor 2 family protein, partial [Fimbriimonas sp.]
MRTTAELARIHVQNIGKPTEQQDLSIYSPNLLVSFPFAPEGHTQSLRGVEAMSNFLAAIGEFTTGHTVEGLTILTDQDRFTVTYAERSVFRSTGRNYGSEIVWIGTLEDDQISSLAEYYNPLAVLAALG